MKAIVLEQAGTEPLLAERTVSKPVPNNNEVLIKIEAIGLNPVDLKLADGRIACEIPAILGHDFSGVIVEGHEYFTKGEAVFGYLPGMQSNGAFAEYLALPACCVAIKPKNLSFREAVAYPLAALTAWQAIRRAKVEPKQRILISGASGAVGIMATQILQDLGCTHLTLLVYSEKGQKKLTGYYPHASYQIIAMENQDEHTLLQQLKAEDRHYWYQRTFDFSGGLGKLACLKTLDFEGQAVSIVEEPAFEHNIWDARESILFQRSATVHFEFVGARGLFGGPTDWLVYQQDLQVITRLLNKKALHFNSIGYLKGLSIASVTQGFQALKDRTSVHDKWVIDVSG